MTRPTTYSSPDYERGALLNRLGRAAQAVCFRPASIEAALQLQAQGRVRCHWEDGLLIVQRATTPHVMPIQPGPLIA